MSGAQINFDDYPVNRALLPQFDRQRQYLTVLKKYIYPRDSPLSVLTFRMNQRPGIYVERLIRGDIESVWEQTQRPQLHELWDLRFTKIEYLPRASESAPQRFKYSTRIGFGLHIDGHGESTGNREASTGLRTSALRFWSDDPKSLIGEARDIGSTFRPKTACASLLGMTTKRALEQ